MSRKPFFTLSDHFVTSENPFFLMKLIQFSFNISAANTEPLNIFFVAQVIFYVESLFFLGPQHKHWYTF